MICWWHAFLLNGDRRQLTNQLHHPGVPFHARVKLRKPGASAILVEGWPWWYRTAYARLRTRLFIPLLYVCSRIFEGINLNDDKSPMIDLLSCIVCKERMKIEKSMPDPQGLDIIQYRCQQCGSVEHVRLFRRSRDAAS